MFEPCVFSDGPRLKVYVQFHTHYLKTLTHTHTYLLVHLLKHLRDCLKVRSSNGPDLRRTIYPELIAGESLSLYRFKRATHKQPLNQRTSNPLHQPDTHHHQPHTKRVICVVLFPVLFASYMNLSSIVHGEHQDKQYHIERYIHV